MLVPIPALNDNYIWLYRRENFPVIVIDIPEITRLIPYLESNKLDVEAVLLTHNHDDHVQGVAEFKQYYPNVPVFGPAECAKKGATNILESGVINTAHYHIEVLPSGGHTAACQLFGGWASILRRCVIFCRLWSRIYGKFCSNV